VPLKYFNARRGAGRGLDTRPRRGRPGELIAFLLTGIANSIVGFSVIFGCLMAGASGVVANAAGYAVALTCSFILNRHYVFGISGTVSKDEVVRFLAAFSVAYLANMAVLLSVQSVIGEGNLLAQFPAIVTYSVVFFLLSRWFVFKRRCYE
jgi:putative flippase GtrA